MRTRLFGALAGASALSTILAACSSNPGSTSGGDGAPERGDATGVDDSGDGTVLADTGSGAAPGDATTDVGEEAAPDRGVDGAPEVGVDTEADAGGDATIGVDGGGDAGHDAQLDASTDALGDATSDGGSDAGLETGANGATEAGVDSAVDASTESGADGANEAAVDASAPMVLIAEVRSRGAGGAADEFVELYNPGAASIVLDASWTVDMRSTAGSTYAVVWKGSGTTIPAHGHFLIVGSAYAQSPASDSVLSSGISDAAAVRVIHSGASGDALCFYYDSMTMGALSGAGFTCAGTPVSNSPHNNTSTGNSDAALERRPGGAGGNGQNTGDNSVDFKSTAPANPQNTLSPPVP